MSSLNFISRPFHVSCNSRGRCKGGRKFLRGYTFDQFLEADESNTFGVCFSLNSEIFYNTSQGSSYGLTIMTCEVLTFHLNVEEFIYIPGNHANKDE